MNSWTTKLYAETLFVNFLGFLVTKKNTKHKTTTTVIVQYENRKRRIKKLINQTQTYQRPNEKKNRQKAEAIKSNQNRMDHLYTNKNDCVQHGRSFCLPLGSFCMVEEEVPLAMNKW